MLLYKEKNKWRRERERIVYRSERKGGGGRIGAGHRRRFGLGLKGLVLVDFEDVSPSVCFNLATRREWR